MSSSTTSESLSDLLPEATLRAQINTANRIVVKIGSSSLTEEDFSVASDKIDRIVDAVVKRMETTDVIIVSSGTVAAGMRPLGLADKQATASVGQIHLANEWSRSFARHGRTVGQVLLTASDAGQRDRTRNAKRTIDKLLHWGVVPIVNENDTVATSEMRFGDNDRLSALVAQLTESDALYLLSDVDGLYDKNPAEEDAKFISEVRTGEDLKEVAAGDGGKVGTGGMASKVQAARLATRAGIPVLLTSAERIHDALGETRVGTVFHTRPERKLSAWKFWALYSADTGGVIRIDEGAVKAVTVDRHSLLSVGITDVDGEFTAGEIVEIVGPDGQIIGRGEVSVDSTDLRQMAGKPSTELPDRLRRPVVHADYLSNFASRV